MLLMFACGGGGDDDPTPAEVAEDQGPIPVSDAVIAAMDAHAGADVQPGADAALHDAVSVGTDGSDLGQPGDGSASSDDLGDGAPLPDAAPPVPVALPRRECGVVLRYGGPGAEILVAGEFTGWGDAPRPMEREPDGTFALRLGPSDGLTPGATYAYKLIVDGSWRLDPGQTRQKYDGNCVNSAFLVPDCDARPDLVPLELNASAAGHLTARLRLEAATGGTDQGFARLRVDGRPVEATFAEGVYTVELDGLVAGRHTLSVTAEDLDHREAEPLDLPFWVENGPFEWRDATLYMLMVDRFANGDRNNDDPVRVDTPYPQDWHGGDLQGVEAVIESGYFEHLGVKALWLSPVNEQTDGSYPGREAGRNFSGYHGYWPVQGREVEPRFGGNEALRRVVRAAHARGIRVLLDLINNQVHEQHVYYQQHPEWFRTGCVCGGPGCGWSERPLDCLFAPYLPDINWRVPEAERQFVADALHWVAEYEVDGFRVDAVKHVETTAVYNLRAALDARFAGPGAARLVMLGETAVGEGDRFDDGCGERYDDGYQWVSAYAGPNGLDGQFDFPSHHRMQWALLTDTLPYDGLEAIVRDMGTRYAPGATHVRFLGSHDSNRMATRAARDPAAECRYPGGAPCETLPGVVRDAAVYGRLKRAFAALYAFPGIPLLYSGDELAQPGGNDPDNRRDMVFPAALAGVALAVGAPTEAQLDLSEFVAALGRARRDLPAVRRGVREVLVAEPDLWVVAFREASGARALVAVNRGGPVEGRALPVADEWPALVARAGQGVVEAEPGALRVTLGAGEAAWFGP